jgi:hypothetical protein
VNVKTAEAKIDELDVVALRYREGAWPAGTEGAVVIDHGAHKMVEISDEEGRCVNLVSLPQERLRLTRKSPH